MKQVDVLIIGAGPAGLAAAIGAKSAGCENILVLDREDAPGGILKQCIHNGFGLHTFKEELTGPEYAARFVEKAKTLDIEIWSNTMVVEVTEDRCVKAVSHEHGYVVLQAKAIVLAMGCRERPRGALATPGERCSGIYTAGTAQKMVNMMGLMPGRQVVILGSGDIGLIMARRMTFMGAKVLACVELMPYSSGLQRNIVQCLEDFDIPLYLSHTVVDIKGRERLEGVTVAKVDGSGKPIPGTEFELECDTLLLSVGLLPENELSMMAGVEISRLTSGPVVNEEFETKVEGIFACGNVLHVHDLVDFVSQEAEQAGKNAARFAMEGKREKTLYSVEAGNGVSALVPDFVSGEPREDVKLMFRPRGVFSNVTVRVRRGDQVVASKKAVALTPGEMVSMKLKANVLKEGAGPIRVDIE